MFLKKYNKDFASKFAEFKPIIKENKKIIKRYGIDELILRHFEKTQGYRFDLENPATFSEKLAARKREKNSLFVKCCDKIAVRDYVAQKIGEEYLIPLYYSGRHLTRKAWENLPEEFVAKTNNGSGTVDVIRNKSAIRFEDLWDELEDWLSVEFGYIDGELFYNKIPPRILVEKLLLDESGQVPKDYKIHCFRNNGNKKKIIQIDYDRFSDHKRNIYDESFNKLDVTIGFKEYRKIDSKPNNWDELLSIADRLSEDFDYVRVDLYDLNNRIYFGELTFCHGGAGEKIRPTNYDKLFGGYWV